LSKATHPKKIQPSAHPPYTKPQKVLDIYSNPGYNTTMNKTPNNDPFPLIGLILLALLAIACGIEMLTPLLEILK
jgi:hypothetical protein